MKLLIDADSLMFVKERETVEKTIISVDLKIEEIVRLSGCNEYALFLSGKGNYRLEVDSEYKANRKDLVKPTFYKMIREHLVDKYEALEEVGFEADDLVSTLYRSDMNSYRIATSDKDILLNLPGRHFNTHYKKMSYEKELSTDESNFNLSVQLLMGDKIDNIPSSTLTDEIIKKYKIRKTNGVGKVTAKNIINSGFNNYGYSYLETAMDVFRMCGGDFQSQYKLISIGMFNSLPSPKFNIINGVSDIYDVVDLDMLTFGKYKGMSYKYVYEINKSYIIWLLDNSTDKKIVNIIEKILIDDDQLLQDYSEKLEKYRIK